MTFSSSLVHITCNSQCYSLIRLGLTPHCKVGKKNQIQAHLSVDSVAFQICTC